MYIHTCILGTGNCWVQVVCGKYLGVQVVYKGHWVTRVAEVGQIIRISPK